MLLIPINIMKNKRIQNVSKLLLLTQLVMIKYLVANIIEKTTFLSKKFKVDLRKISLYNAIKSDQYYEK